MYPQKRLKEALIILLYCSMTAASSSVFPKGFFDFALPHALSLAEAGSNIEDKRIGKMKYQKPSRSTAHTFDRLSVLCRNDAA